MQESKGKTEILKPAEYVFFSQLDAFRSDKSVSTVNSHKKIEIDYCISQ